MESIHAHCSSHSFQLGNRSILCDTWKYPDSFIDIAAMEALSSNMKFRIHATVHQTVWFQMGTQTESSMHALMIHELNGPVQLAHREL